jgi:predicted solute-binding protein
MLHGDQSESVDLSFSIPSVCAQRVEEGLIDVGLVPVVEIARQNLEIVPGVGITCFGAVRSILLFSRVPWPSVRTLAADVSSRTSVELARVILRERYGAEPDVASHQPVLADMLRDSDAALIIGDPALRLHPQELPYESLDLGAEWLALTGLPMVFAAWAGKPGIPLSALERITAASYRFGKARIAEIVEQEHSARGLTRELAEQYLRQHIRFELGADELKGLEAFLDLTHLPRRTFAQTVI